MIVSHLSRIMGERRIKQRELAEKAGLAFNTVANLYHDRWGMVDRETLDKICKALNVELGDLLEYIPENRAEETQEAPKAKVRVRA